MLGSFVGEEKRIEVKSFTVALDLPLIDNALESGVCSGKEWMEIGFGCFFIGEGGGVEGVKGVELLLEPDDIGFYVVVVVFLEGAVVDGVA